MKLHSEVGSERATGNSPRAVDRSSNGALAACVEGRKHHGLFLHEVPDGEAYDDAAESATEDQRIQQTKDVSHARHDAEDGDRVPIHGGITPAERLNRFVFELQATRATMRRGTAELERKERDEPDDDSG
eukprot:CAMPEP_0183592566 /NCGR_PEP_ID=MMETSP0371-20130417/168218_1 /TAXON_ID=268820 /ORGANISM="Peridinium aciculiferum, Strain PAER-2" /LENGTH=129 /DNA_ID=CAMNT_0025804109 /DNA_START=253 /DNA_END=638 /DNA_ORIENTATION=-